VNSRVDPTGEGWTYGAEHELADWDARLVLPGGYARSPDHTIVNSNGIAAQPNPSVYPYGGEINTPPDEYPSLQADRIDAIKAQFPNARVNHRSNLHVHVRVPGLRDNLGLLKRVQQCIHEQLPKVLPELEPIPKGATPAEQKRARRRRVSHQTFLTRSRLAGQLKADTVEEFFEREVPKSKSGAVMWHAQPRVCVNLRQLLQTNTIEFRHFPGTLDRDRLLSCILWCRDFLRYALRDRNIVELWGQYRGHTFPKFTDQPLQFDERLEIGYQATASNIGLTREEILENITAIKHGWATFALTPAYRAAAQRAGALPRERV
jgi:hypothetical protein